MPARKLNIEIGDAAKIKWQRSPWPGVHYKFLQIGPGARNIIDLLKVEAGVALRPHRHAVVQRSFLVAGKAKTSDGRVLNAGSWITIPAGARHGHVAVEEVLWVDFFPGLLTWFMDDGKVYILSADGRFNDLGRLKRLGKRPII